MRIQVVLLSIFFFVFSVNAESLWKDNFNLFSDHKAKKVGDIITITISETASAIQKASTINKENSNTNVNGGSGFLNFFPLGSAGASSSYNGNGSTIRNNSFKATITAIITEVLPNGLYKIEGKRKLSLNSEVEVITIKGLVRDEDISRDNKVESTKIAQAEITYSGKGVVSNSQKPGLLQRILQTIF